MIETELATRKASTLHTGHHSNPKEHFVVFVTPRAYTWLCSQELLLVKLGNHTRCQGSNLGQQYERQVTCPLYYFFAHSRDVSNTLLKHCD